MNSNKYIVYLFFCLLVCSCGFNRFEEPEAEAGTGGSGIRPNAKLELLYSGRYDSGRVMVENLVFEGYVTANDLSGNFFGSIIIQDGTAAVEILAGFGGLCNIYPEGRRVVVYGRDAAFMRTNGIMGVGLHINPYSAYRVEPFGAPAIMDRYIRPDTIIRIQQPEIFRISDLGSNDCGKLVKIDGLIVDTLQNGLTWASGEGSLLGRSNSFIPPDGIRYFSNASGCEIAVITSSYADFAGEVIPETEVSLTGILLRGDFGREGEEIFGLKLRNIDDVVYP